MKKWILPIVGVCVVALLYVIFGTDLILDSTIKYKVFFEEETNVAGYDILHGDIVIGKVTGNVDKASLAESMVGKYTIYEIAIDKKYEDLIHTNCTFYSDDGNLVYTRMIERAGTPLPPESMIRGFENKMVFFTFRTNTAMAEKISDFNDWCTKHYKGLFT